MQNQRGSAASASSCSACGQTGKARTQTKVHSLHTCIRKHRHVPPPVKERYRLHVLNRKHNELDTSMNNTHGYNICIQFLPIYQDQYLSQYFILKKKKCHAVEHLISGTVGQRLKRWQGMKTASGPFQLGYIYYKQWSVTEEINGKPLTHALRSTGMLWELLWIFRIHTFTKSIVNLKSCSHLTTLHQHR